ncbi:TonB-dependent receptor [Bowmanella dokdonensis]|uniref:TonB-dependent receptor n=1 Tax=Bowmanella dokdonensis TaxID=751969 RepID=A0A939DRX8_9ALTE|nr:TonB-dependent receptor [Bowmanella dokdonensis]MBN7827247.1 TonB-dependent receptor [Bowmanella dokdonensis]
MRIPRFAGTWFIGVTLSPILCADDSIEKITVLGHQTDMIGAAVSASEGYVGQQEINIRPMLRIGEMMELVPGMVATQHSGSGKANQYFLRGFNLDHGTDFATHIDGMPVNMRTHGHGQGYTDLNFIIPELIDTLHFKKGPYYSDVGDFSSAGSAHFQTLSRLEAPTLKLTLGEDQFVRALGYGGYTLGQGRVLAAVEQQRYDGPWQGIDEDVGKTNFLAKYVQPAAGGQWSLTLMGYDNRWNSADQIPQRAVEAGLISELGVIDPTVGGESSRYSLSTAIDWQQGSLSAYVIDYDMNLWSNFTYFLDNPVDGDQFEQVDKRKIYGLNGHYHFDLFNARVTLGGALQLDNIDEVGLFKTAARQRLGGVRSDTVEQLSTSLYASVQYPLSENIRLSGGVRYDHYDFDVQTRLNENDSGVDLTANSGERDDSLVSFKGSATYLLNDNNELYLAAGQGFHSNDARGTTTVIDPNDGSAVTPVDPLVRSHGSEIGWRTQISDQLNASVSLWQLSLDSELLFVGDAGNTEASRPSKRNGFELTAYYRPTRGLTLDIEYAASQSRFDDNLEGSEIPGAIDQVIQAGASYAMQNGITTTLRVRHFGERPLDETASRQSDPSTVVNLLAEKRWSQFALRAEVLNVFDANDHDIDYFYASRLAGEPADGVEDIHYHVIEPRTVRVTLSYRYK